MGSVVNVLFLIELIFRIGLVIGTNSIILTIAFSSNHVEMLSAVLSSVGTHAGVEHGVPTSTEGLSVDAGLGLDFGHVHPSNDTLDVLSHWKMVLGSSVLWRYCIWK